jgi:RNA 2',3'-cyclic 3'-phosphodiesterase
MRLFVAFDVPEPVRQALADLIAMLKPHCQTTRWARPEGLHVTLKFIGHAMGAADIGPLDSLRAALATVRSAKPVEMHFGGVGFFPDARRPRVFWCGVRASGNVAQLVAGVQRAVDGPKIPGDVPQNVLAFVPHVTLARFEPRGAKHGASREPCDELVRAANEFKRREFGFVRESQFHLFESLLKPTGAEYKKIETYSFLKEST